MKGQRTRKELLLHKGWRFCYGDETAAWQKGYDDSGWRCITVPHDWAVEHPFSVKNSSGTGYLPGGTGFYRNTFFLPEAYKGHRIYIRFDGVYKHSMTWCNGYYLGKWAYGYSEFVYDITDFACFGETPNVIAVRVDHHDIADSRWFTGSGIYRKVTVLIKSDICINHHGVFIHTPQADEKNAVISIETTVQNAREEPAELLVRQLLYDRDGRQAVVGEEQVCVAPQSSAVVLQSVAMADPMLWSVDSPYLYRNVTEIIESGCVLDDETNAVGIRSFSFDPDRGFFLNGVHMKLKGVCMHHDAGCLGAAVREKVWERRLAALKAMGCNAIRMSHNPHMPELYDLCDRMGFLVIDEAFDEWEGVKNKWTNGHNVYPPAHFGYYEDFPEWHERDLTAMVLRDRNHPSVILWSIGNEVDYPNDPYCHPSFQQMTGNNDANKPTQEMLYDPNRPNAERLAVLARRLSAIVKASDTTRPVTAALAFPELSNQTGYADALDVVGYNYKEHLYQADHAAYPRRALLGSENAKGLAEWKAVMDHDYIAGQFLWTGIDFLGETVGWPCHGSEAGLLNVAGFEKPGYYFRQSLWADHKMLRLFACDAEDAGNPLYSPALSRAWHFSKGRRVKVICFTNCSDVELFMNGKSLGKFAEKDNAGGYYICEMPFEAGELKAIGRVGDNLVEDALRTAGAAAGLTMQTSDTRINADGLDMTHITVTVVDREGGTVHNAEDWIDITVKGPGVILGVENGNLWDETAYAKDGRRAYNGKLLLYVASAGEPGEIVVTAAGQRLSPAEIRIYSED